MSVESESDTTEVEQPNPSDRDSRAAVEPYKQRENLYRWYIEDELSQSKIAEKYGVTQQNISYWLRKHEIEKEKPTFYRNETRNGKIQYTVPDEDCSFHEHDMVAAMNPEFETAEIFWNGEGMEKYGDDEEPVVHHKMGALYGIDIVLNLEVMKQKEHTSDHRLGQATDPPSEVLAPMFPEDDLEDYSHFGSREKRLENWERIKERRGIDDGDQDDGSQ